MPTQIENTDPDSIVSFWLGPDQTSVEQMKGQWKLWYTADPETDNRIREAFGETLSLAESGQLDHWQETPDGSLALVILLDQFSRNLFRGTADAYRNDAKALLVADHAVESGQHLLMSIPGRVMLYHPYHHAEKEPAQTKAIQLFSALKDAGDDSWQGELENHLKFVRSHAELIRQFGRFPHRNGILNRPSTTEELAHLAKDNRGYGQS